MIITTDVEMFQIVYLITDPYQLKKQIVCVSIGPGNVLQFCLQGNGEKVWHYRDEFTFEPSELQTVEDDN